MGPSHRSGVISGGQLLAGKRALPAGVKAPIRGKKNVVRSQSIYGTCAADASLRMASYRKREACVASHVDAREECRMKI